MSGSCRAFCLRSSPAQSPHSKVPSEDSVTCKYIKQISLFMSLGFANFTVMYSENFASFRQDILNLRPWAVIDPCAGVIC